MSIPMWAVYISVPRRRRIAKACGAPVPHPLVDHAGAQQRLHIGQRSAVDRRWDAAKHADTHTGVAPWYLVGYPIITFAPRIACAAWRQCLFLYSPSGGENILRCSGNRGFSLPRAELYKNRQIIPLFVAG